MLRRGRKHSKSRMGKKGQGIEKGRSMMSQDMEKEGMMKGEKGDSFF